MSKPFYITTAIDYVNGQPHLGHAYEKVIADVIARARRSLGQEVFFLTGLDEHGQKVQQAASARKTSPKAYCDELAADWKAFAKRLGLTNNDFVRTTEGRHQTVVQACLERAHAAGHFYKKAYSGFYSLKEETFLTPKDQLPDGSFDPSWGEVIELKEEDYFFRLGEHQQWLMDYIGQNPHFIVPEYRRNEVLGLLKSTTLEDLCISRPVSRLSWGIPIPFDREYVTWVWFDALVNYISIPAAHGDRTVAAAIGGTVTDSATALWPADVHVIGKDILKFHAVYWPIMLKALGLPLPKQILVHGWWQKDGQKISKATGNVVEPVAVINEWGLDAFRYYVLRELDIGPDGNWTDAGFRARYSAELAKGLGNFINRSLTMLKRYRNGIIPAKSDELSGQTAKTVEEVRTLLENNQLQAALVAIQALITRADQYIEKSAPFKLAKDPAQAKRLGEVLYNLAETCRIVAVLYYPFLPGTSSKIYEQLGLAGKPDRFSDAVWGQFEPGHQIGNPTPLFPLKEEK
ncbi:MAG TPA: class I tRNA ligase family protein [Candidatus Sulfotelmatobacter sp.]|nr:class I tRNA ligase family protein [Candidatus Sulfotelmatobacter sp.]